MERVRALSLAPRQSSLPSLANECIIFGSGKKADVVWTKYQFAEICYLMLNGNDPNFFLIPYQDESGEACFAKARQARADKRAAWAWDCITGKSKSPASIGFYPTNSRGETRWGAMDFDSHDGKKLLARERALGAFGVLRSHTELFLILGTSGSSGGWHLFAYAPQFYPVEEWSRLFRQVAEKLGIKIEKGTCEIFPIETRGRFGGGAIRGPGTWNPKSGDFGLIHFENLKPLLELPNGNGSSSRKEIVPSLYSEEATYE